MGINTERDIEANLQIGPTDQGMVRIFIEANGWRSQWISNPKKPRKLQTKSALPPWQPAASRTNRPAPAHPCHSPCRQADAAGPSPSQAHARAQG